MTKLWLKLAELSQKVADFFLNLTSKNLETDEQDLLHYTLILKQNGDVYLESTCLNFSEESVNIIATLFFLLNSGKLIDLNIQSIQTWIEDDPDQEAFCSQVLGVWQILNAQALTQQNETAAKEEPLINPLNALEPDIK